MAVLQIIYLAINVVGIVAGLIIGGVIYKKKRG